MRVIWSSSVLTDSRAAFVSAFIAAEGGADFRAAGFLFDTMGPAPT